MKKPFLLFLSSFLSIVLVFLSFSGAAYSSNNEITVFSGNDSVIIPVNDNDITNELTRAFLYCAENADENNIYTIKTPEGEFNTSKNIYLTSYTTLDMSGGTTLINAALKAGNIFLSPNGVGGYEGLVNFTMKGGTLTYAEDNKNGNCLVRIAHARDIIFDGVTFTNNYQSHDVEIAACNNTVFNECVFDGQTSDLTETSSEALQIDILEKTMHFTDMEPYDSTMNKNITVSGCTFKNLVRGVGTHSSFAGYYQSSIKIINNTFENISSTAVTFFNYIDSEISGNSIINCGQGIHYYMMHNDSNLSKVCVLDGGKINTDCNTVICNNKIDVCSTKDVSAASPIFIFGNNVTSDKDAPFKSGDYYAGGITVKNNSISTTGYGIRLYDVKKSEILKNTITRTTKSKQGIFLDACSDGNNISENKIIGFDAAIDLKGASSNNTIASNDISSCGGYGIIVQGKSNKSVIKKNKITSSGNNAVILTGSSASEISSNTIISPKKHGISVTESSAVTDIKSNSIKNSTQCGIIVQLSSKVSNLNGNSIASSGKASVYISASAVTSINSNNITSSKHHGICILNSSGVNNINSNTVKSSAVNGIYIDAESNAGYIKSNTVTSSKNNAVSIYGTVKGYAVSNTLKSNAKCGLYFAPGSKGNVYNNTYSSNKSHNAYSAGSKKSYAFANAAMTSASVSKKSNTATVKWKKVGTASSYQIFRSASKNGAYTKIAEVSSSKTSYTDKKLTKGKTYYYRVRVIRKMNGVTAYSSFSPVKSIKI